MQYTYAQLKRMYLFKTAVIFTIVTFLGNQAIEALVVAEFVPVWALRFSLITTAVLFPVVMLVAWMVINKKDYSEDETYEERVLNIWLLVCSILLLVYVIYDQIMQH
jgi:hypothetical protein